MPKHMKMKIKMRGRGGMNRGGVPAAGVGSTVGQWIEDWLLGWLGFADGGEMPSKAELQTIVGDLTMSEQDQLLKEAKKDLTKAVKAGDVELPASAPAAGVGSTVGQWVEDWLLGWLGLSHGGEMPYCARGGMAMKRGHSVFH